MGGTVAPAATSAFRKEFESVGKSAQLCRRTPQAATERAGRRSGTARLKWAWTVRHASHGRRGASLSAAGYRGGRQRH